MSAVSLRASFHLHDCRNDRVRKTAWVRSLLQQSSETVYPPPERIVWCYSQWQPAYTQMLVVMPHIEFVKGIPTALEQGSYFDVNKQNLIVFDDQTIDASKDKRIMNLFTRGSHHRNLRGCLHETGVTFAPGQFAPVPSHGSTFVYMIPPQNVMPERVTPAWDHPGCCTGVRISLRYEISQRYHVNAKRPHVSVWNRSAGGLERVAHA